LSESYEGSVHDKRIAEESHLVYGKELELLQDCGFQGYAPDGLSIQQPCKKPKGNDLTAEQKADNQAISRQRVVIEHVIAGVKICRILKDVLRSWRTTVRDRVMLIACGLHNFRLAQRSLCIPYS